jgi:hypothetical protein
MEHVLDYSIPDHSKTQGISGLWVSPADMVQSSRLAAKKAAKSSSEIRTIPLIRCATRSLSAIQRRTVREETSRQFATSLMVKKRGEAGMITPLPKAEAATAL